MRQVPGAAAVGPATNCVQSSQSRPGIGLLSSYCTADFGSYSVLISNAAGSVVSAQAALAKATSSGTPTSILWDFGTATPR